MTSAAPRQHWHSVPVSDLITISHGFAFKGEYFSEYGRDAVTTPGNFLEAGGFRRTETKQRYYSGSIPEAYRLKAGDLIVAMTEQAEGLLGSTAFVPDAGSWLHNQRIGRIRAKSDEVSLKYLYYVFNSFEFRKSVAETAAGTKVKHTSPVKLGTVEILLPPRGEQDRIAGKLDDCDDMILGLERLIAKKQEIKQGFMQQLLTGRSRLPGFTAPWEEDSVGSFLEFKNGLNKGSEFFGSGTPIVNFMDVMNGPLITATDLLGRVTLSRDERRRFSAKKGDIFFTRTSETVEEVGTAAVLVEDVQDAAFSGFILRGRPRATDCDPRFLAYLFQTDRVRRQVTSAATYTTRALTNGRSLSRIVVQVPSLDEQRAIGSVLEDNESELSALEERLKKAVDIKLGMMQQLLTGRTRLPVKEGAA
ncbi:restriction endonuclease subunit S [Streptomyces sp. NPDC002680]|uniref:restriction endonuclease subunit S n=1 Tax=Streptomyces sp. NPDC002680 TaxID=3364659 RepID=UPI0036AA302B